jgi:hypothetical protein
LTSGNRFTIRLTSLTPEDAPGLVADFDSSTAYTWTVATYSGGITGFAPEKFNLNTSDFANNLGGGMFAIGPSGNNLMISFTPVPEPSMILAVAGVAAILGAGVRRWGRVKGQEIPVTTDVGPS